MTDTEDERGDAVHHVTKVTRMTGGHMRRQPPQGEHDRRRPWGVAARLGAETQREEATQRRRETLRMMDLSDFYYAQHHQCGPDSGDLGK